MSQETSFWRNAAIIGVVHVAFLVGLARWSGGTRKPVATDILWLNSSSGVTSAVLPAPPIIPEIPPEPTPEPPAADEQPPIDQSIVPPVKSEIELPAPTPAPTATATPRSTPSATATPKSPPKPTPKETSKPTPKPAPRKTVVAKASPSPRSSSTPAKESGKLAENSTPAKSQSDLPDSPQTNAATAGSGGGGAAGAAQFGWYGSILHDRFFGEWVQPKTALAMGAKMSTLVQLRIETDGRVSNFIIVRSSGNIVIDESVAAVAKRVTRVDPPPAGLAAGGHYDVKIIFELKVE